MIRAFPKEWVGRCSLHFCKAVEKHPVVFVSTFTDKSKQDAIDILADRRWKLKKLVDGCAVTVFPLLECEFYEALVEYTSGNMDAAVDELYDAIAVLMRAICVIEGTQDIPKNGGAS